MIIFDADDISSSHTDNQKIIYIRWRSIGAAEKEISINFSKANTKFCLSLRYNGDESYLYVSKAEY